jgi:cytochrome c oxidase subunit II
VSYRTDFARAFGAETWIAGAVFLLVVATMISAFVHSRLRRRRGHPSSQKAKADKLELSYLGVLAIVAAFLATFSLTLNNRETADPPKAAMTVKVLAFQWCWRFSYVGQPVSVTGRCEGGTLPTLVLPAGRPVRIEVTSADVIHGFWIPYLRWKIYAYPGHVNSFTVTLGQDGRWIGRCSELCGVYHYEMDFYVQVVPPARFDRWLRSRGGSANAVSSG